MSAPARLGLSLPSSSVSMRWARRASEERRSLAVGEGVRDTLAEITYEIKMLLKELEKNKLENDWNTPAVW